MIDAYPSRKMARAAAADRGDREPLVLRWIARENKARLMIDGAMKLHWANDAGRRLIEAADMLHIDGRGIVQARGDLQWKIEHAIKSRARESTIVIDDDGEGIGDNLVITVEMLHDEDEHTFFGVQILNHESALSVWIARLARQFQLTPKQAQILFQMINGRSTEEAAKRMTISVETVRTHVRDLYAKLNVGSREELFAKIRPFYL